MLKCQDTKEDERKVLIMNVGTKFKGQVNGELFEIVDEFTKDNKAFFKIKHLKNGKIYELEKQYVEHLLIDVVKEGADNG